MSQQPKYLLKDVSFDFEKSDKIDYDPHIAYTLPMQGGAASGINNAFLLKSKESLTVEVVKGLEQIELKISMEEFLRRFMGMWGSDTAIVTKLMGLQTEAEAELEGEDLEDYHRRWLEEDVAAIDNKLSNLTLLKSVINGDELPVDQRLALFNIRKKFEDGCKEFKDEVDLYESQQEEITLEDETVVVKSTKDEPDTISGVKKGITPIESKENTNKGDNMDQFQEFLKSAEGVEFLAKAVKAETAETNAIKDAEIAKLQKQAESLQKAENDRILKSFETIVKGYSYVKEDQVEGVVKALMTSPEAVLLTDILKAAEDAVEAAKVEFAQEAGVDVEVKKSSTAQQDAINAKVAAKNKQ